MSEMSTSQKLTVVLAGFAAIAFFLPFLPWVEQTGLLSGAHSGFDLAETTESAASGKNLTPLFLTPVGALLIVLVALLASRGGTFGRVAPILQIVLAIVAVLPPLLIIPDEIAYWSGEVTFTYGLWLTLIAMAAIVIVSVVDLVNTYQLAHRPTSAPLTPQH